MVLLPQMLKVCLRDLLKDHHKDHQWVHVHQQMVLPEPLRLQQQHQSPNIQPETGPTFRQVHKGW